MEKQVTYMLEDVFRTEGVPEFTFVRPPNFDDILVDIRNPGKPVIIEGQSGTGKTTTVKKIIDASLPAMGFEYLSARRSKDMPRIMELAQNAPKGKFIIDDFHRLENSTQAKIADIIKIAAEEYDDDDHPKVVIIGINRVGSELIHLVHDIAKRCGIHRIAPAPIDTTIELIRKGEQLLNIKFADVKAVFSETRGDYWLTQLVCQTVCLMKNVTETCSDTLKLEFVADALRSRVVQRLEHSYHEAVREFCRGRRFRPTNDPYLKVLRCVGEQEGSIVDLTELANANTDVRGSINNIKEKRLAALIESKPICDRYFYYNQETKIFAIEDPALFYYLKHLNWDEIRTACGFRASIKEYSFDFAISFAGENRDLARIIADQLDAFDCAVFYDEYFEANYLGKTWHKTFTQIFGEQSRFVVCLLDKYHVEKIWPSFERECFAPRIAEDAVIPIYLDETPVPGIPRDIVGIDFKQYALDENLHNRITDEIAWKLVERLQDA
ncbi:TIR domain-containing protein [Burkholderia vietnamiensis]|uniref:TIR domain-containing protein n=1 Tax=Burkholderia vietnamiensis TaxID=60552 RepID=UPI0018C88A67|nr:TIR domain-containing protein [Burkholderia vietnamiensis]